MTTPELETEVLRDFDRLRTLAPDWRRLWAAQSPQSVFTTFEWASASWQVYGPSRRLFTPVVFQKGRVVGILPLTIERMTLAFLASPRSDYNDMLCEGSNTVAIVSAALRAVCAAGDEWRGAVLDNLPEDSRIVTVLGQLERSLATRVHLTLRSRCPRVVFDPAGHVLRAVLRKKSLRRHDRGLKTRGDVRFRHVESPEAIRSYLPEFYRQHIARRALAGERSIFLDPRSRRFFSVLVDTFDATTCFRFAVLELDGTPVAFHCGFENGGTFVWYKPAFDVDLWAHSPGEVLLMRLFEYAGARGVRVFDFTVGDEAYKRRFATEARVNYRLQVVPAGFRGRLLRWLLHAKGALKRYPTLYARVEREVTRATSGVVAMARARRRHGVVGMCAKASRLVWRTIGVAHDEVLVFSWIGSAGSERGLSLRLQPGTLSELACLAAEHPDSVPLRSLDRARRRLKDGDRLLFAHDGAACVHVAWTGERSQITDSAQVGHECRVELESEGVVIFDCWTPVEMRGKGIYPWVLRRIAEHARGQGRACWIYCRRDNRPSVRGIEKAGFAPRYAMKRIRVCGRTLLSRVTERG